MAQKLEPVNWELVDEFLADEKVKSDAPANGFVPDEQTAVRIAEALSVALYGAQQTEDQKPFRARLSNGVWTVVGTLSPAGIYGGAATFQISKEDGQVLFAVHGE
jgi:hypothetical protein